MLTLTLTIAFALQQPAAASPEAKIVEYLKANVTHEEIALAIVDVRGQLLNAEPVIGLAVSFAAPVLHVRAGEWTLDRAAGFILLPLVDMVLFAGFFGAAVAYRRTPEIHKRLILAATVALAFAAVARMSFKSPLVFLLIWLSPLFAAMAFDMFTRRRVHPVHVVNVAVLTAAFLRIFFMESEGWLRIGRALLVPFV